MLITVILILTTLGFAALIHAVKRTGVGYENELGFHHGAEPMKAVAALVAKKGPEQPPGSNLAQAKNSQTRRRSRQPAKKAESENPIPTFQLELDANSPRFLRQEISSVEKR